MKMRVQMRRHFTCKETKLIPGLTLRQRTILFGPLFQLVPLVVFFRITFTFNFKLLQPLFSVVVRKFGPEVELVEILAQVKFVLCRSVSPAIS